MRKCEFCGRYFDGTYWFHEEEGKLPKGFFCSPKCQIAAKANGIEGSAHALEKTIAAAATAAAVGVGAWKAGSWIARKVRGLIKRSPVLMEFFTSFGQWYIQKFKWLRTPAGTPNYKLPLEVLMWCWGGFFYIPIYYFVSHKTQER